MGTPIHTVMFDLGVVLVHLDYEPAIRRALPLCDPDKIAHGSSFLSLLGRTPIVDAYERGEHTAEEFFAQFVAHTGFRGSFDLFADIWRSIFRENTPMIDFGRDLAQRYPVYFMTNASDLHVPWVFDHLPRLQFFKDYAASWEMRAGKPDSVYYQRALARFGVPAEGTLFVDDRPENIETAELLGFTCVLYQHPEQAIGETLKKLV
jgi:FMN phosphatase YigB (HAD superfamily)